MITPLPKDKGQRMAQKIKFVVIGQALRLGERQIDGKGQQHRTMRIGIEDADAPCLDTAANRFGAIGDQPAPCLAQQDPVIGDQGRTEGHHFNGKRGFT